MEASPNSATDKHRAYRRRLRLLRVAAPPGLRARLRRELVAYSLVIGSTARR